MTNGETVWGVDSLFNDSLIAIAVDTIWYQTRTDGVTQPFLFPRTEFNPWFNGLSWAGLRLLAIPGVGGYCAVARAIDGWGSESSDQYAYFFHLSGDSVLRRQRISIGSDDSYSLRAAEIWPRLPQTSDLIMMIRSRHYSVYHAGCDESTTVAASVTIRLANYTTVSMPGLRVGLFERSDTLRLAYFTGSSSWIYGCQEEDSYWDNRFTIGSSTFTSAFQSTNVDTFDQWGRVVAQEDFDGTKRIFYSNGNCYNAATGAIEFTNSAIADTTLSAYVRNAPGEDFLALQNNRFLVYDGRTGELVDSTTEIQGVPQKKFVSSGFDELLTYDAAQKLVRIYRPFETLLSVQATVNGNVILNWTPSPGATSYRLDRSDDPDFNNFFPDYFAPTVTSIEFQPTASIEFFRVTPIFE